MLVAIPISLQWMLPVLWLGELWIFTWIGILHMVTDGVGHAAKSFVVMQQTTTPCWPLPLAMWMACDVMVLLHLFLGAKALGGR